MMNSTPRRLVVLGLAGALSAWGAIAVSVAATKAPRREPHLSERRIVRIAEQAAAQAGDPTPTLIQHSAGTRRNANRVDSGDIVPGRQRSYLIAERGHFVFKDVPTPSAAPAPAGTVLTLIVSAASGRITDIGVADRYPRLARLGPVHTDRRATRPAGDPHP